MTPLLLDDFVKSQVVKSESQHDTGERHRLHIAAKKCKIKFYLFLRTPLKGLVVSGLVHSGEFNPRRFISCVKPV